MKRLIAFFSLFLLGFGQAGAYYYSSPFDQILKNRADISLADIYQDASSKDIYFKICNVGYAMDSSVDLALRTQKKGGRLVANTLYGISL